MARASVIPVTMKVTTAMSDLVANAATRLMATPASKRLLVITPSERHASSDETSEKPTGQFAVPGAPRAVTRPAPTLDSSILS